MGFLPTTKTVKKTDDPKNLILFGLPKVGKTTVLSKLPGALLIDMENGTDYVSDAFVMKAQTVNDLFKIAKALKEEDHQFKFVVLDTITAMATLALDLAAKRYQESQLGRNWQGTGKDILFLPMGAGYAWQKKALEEIISWFTSDKYNLVVTGHVRDKNLTEGGTELVVKQLDLSGNTSNVLAANSDGIAYLYRDTETGDLMANFGDMNSVLTGSRIPHLAGKTIQLAERKMNEETQEWEVVAHWDRVFTSLKQDEA